MAQSLIYASSSRYSSNGYPLLYDKGGRLLRSSGSLKVMLYTWWDFDPSAVGHDDALINGEVVCYGHATTHIIDYNVNQSQVKHEGQVRIPFTMSISAENSSWCNFRVWMGNGGTSGYFEAAPSKRAEVSGSTNTVAQFVIVINYDDETVRLMRRS